MVEGNVDVSDEGDDSSLGEESSGLPGSLSRADADYLLALGRQDSERMAQVSVMLYYDQATEDGVLRIE